MENREIRPGDIFKHFKNKLYQIIAIAYHSESKEKMVVYQALYGDFKTYVRPYDMFMSEVDREKYPEVKEKYRFTKVNLEEREAEVTISTTEDVNNTVEIKTIEPALESNEYEGVNPLLLQFLDYETTKDKIEYLRSIKSKLDDRLISDIAVSLDLTIEEGSLDEKYDSLLFCLKTKAKFECGRLR